MHMHNLHTLVHVTLFESVSPFLTLTLNTFLEASSNSFHEIFTFFCRQNVETCLHSFVALCARICVFCVRSLEEKPDRAPAADSVLTGDVCEDKVI